MARSAAVAVFISLWLHSVGFYRIIHFHMSVKTLKGDSDGLWASAVSSVSGCLSLFGEPRVERALEWSDSHFLWPTCLWISRREPDTHAFTYTHTSTCSLWGGTQAQHTLTCFLTLWCLLSIHIFIAWNQKSHSL